LVAAPNAVLAVTETVPTAGGAERTFQVAAVKLDDGSVLGCSELVIDVMFLYDEVVQFLFRLRHGGAGCPRHHAACQRGTVFKTRNGFPEELPSAPPRCLSAWSGVPSSLCWSLAVGTLWF
jgi:hypothetical protein